MQTKEYNGWTNYETWLVKLWMDNDEGSYRYHRGNAQEVYDAAEADETFSKVERAALDLADNLKDSYEEHAQGILKVAGVGCSVWAHLLGGALSEVNWYEIAEHLIDDEVDKESEAA